MTGVSQAQEPSMEEILASIRRIIADDESGKAGLQTGEPEAPEPRAAEPPALDDKNSQADIDALFAKADEPAEGVLELTPEMRADAPFRPAGEPPAEARRPTPTPEEDVVFVEAEPSRPRHVEPQVTEPGERLLSPAADQAVTAAFSSLTHLILQRDARTLEDLVQDMLRPLLKSWLDDNLPQLVERLVREEIDRVARGRR